MSTKLWISHLQFFAIAKIAMSSTLITLRNSGSGPIWGVVVSSPNSPELPAADTGFLLSPSESRPVPFPSNWSGAVWARTGCLTDAAGAFRCRTGSCGYGGALACPRGTPVPPTDATVARFEAAGDGGGGYKYSVSTVATGLNLAASVTPVGQTSELCVPAECVDSCGEDAVAPRFACFSATNYVVEFSDAPFHGNTHLSPRKAHKQEKEHSKKTNGRVLVIVCVVGGFGSVGIMVVVGYVVKKFGTGINPRDVYCCFCNCC